MFQTKLADESLYKADIDGMRLRLVELQLSDKEAQRIRVEGLNGNEELDKILHHQGLLFVPEIIQTELINWHHNNFLAEHIGINKTKDLVGRKY